MPPRKRKPGPRSSSDAVSVILPNALYLGPRSAASSTAFLTSEHITHVLSIGISPSRKVDDVVYHRLALADSTTSPLDVTLKLSIEIIGAALESKKGAGKILVHCSAGVSRSPTIVVGYLMKKRGMTLKEALGRVIRSRPQVSPNSGFLRQLKELEVELRGDSSIDVDELPRREVDRLAYFADASTGGSGSS
ncbi:phosphatases II [Coprinellus micaceus]|uniref:protein-tyrosine-phosphatase n=1 Tax=Coprinellus micaceus TaxID=71717 RepID=A0A4Y7TG58_COPMI|nr:phosphatases II [Coprinellus micaceus]